jgi:hypothetical protein
MLEDHLGLSVLCVIAFPLSILGVMLLLAWLEQPLNRARQSTQTLSTPLERPTSR